MKFNTLGGTGLKVSKIGFGAGHLDRAFLNGSDKEVNHFLNGLLDLGINFIDTAGCYGPSEELIGRHLANKLNSFVVSSKTGHGQPGVTDWTGEAVTKGIESSLRRLNVESIDIMHLHSCDLEVLKRGEVIEAMLENKKVGKVKFIAYSGQNEALEFAITSRQFDVIQTSDNLIDQHSKLNFIKNAKALNLGIIGKRPLANFIWKYNSEPESFDLKTYWNRLKQVQHMLEPSIAFESMIYKYLQRSDWVDTYIIGTSSYKNLIYNLEKLEEIGNSNLNTSLNVNASESSCGETFKNLTCDHIDELGLVTEKLLKIEGLAGSPYWQGII